MDTRTQLGTWPARKRRNMVDSSATHSACPGLELSGGTGTEKQEGRVS